MAFPLAIQCVGLMITLQLFALSSKSVSAEGFGGVRKTPEAQLLDGIIHEVSAALGSASSKLGLDDKQVQEIQLGDALLNEISAVPVNDTANGDGFRASAQRNLPELGAALQPILKALPSNEGRFGAVAVRYALHRLFVRRHGWFVVGLDPEGQAWNKKSPSEVAVLERMPASVRALFAERLQGPGLTSEEIAVLAALVEHLVHQEAFQRLSSVYHLMEVPTRAKVSVNVTQHAVEMYMASYLIGRDPTKATRKSLQRQYAVIDRIYPTWNRTRAFVNDVLRKEQADAKVDEPGFASANRAVAKIGEQYGKWQNRECLDLKAELLVVEDAGTGRVRLADFYGLALHQGKWQFKESISYLRQLGALDESSPNNLRVIIANYINGHSNCIASSQYFSNCCISECESIVGHLEQELESPDAAPADIAALIAALPSSTVSANRTLQATMLHRLNAIATSHNGAVPLYGRLFAQWLHHAYPRECPYPHMSGKTNPQQGKDLVRAGLSPTASPEEMRKIAGATAAAKPSRSHGVEEAPWSYEEELFVPRSSTDDEPTLWLALNGVVFVAFIAVAALGFTLTKAARAGRRALRQSKVVHNDVSKFCAV